MKKLFLAFMCVFLALTAGCSINGSCLEKLLALLKKNAKYGIFIDDRIQGVRYLCRDQWGTTEGITDEAGLFQYREGQTVTFYIGDVQLGEAVPATGVITPVSLVPGATDVSNQTVQNIARFLLTLDSDGDPSTGIKITDTAVTQCAGKSVNFNLSAAEFAAQPSVTTVVANLGTTLLDEATVTTHLATLNDRVTEATTANEITYFSFKGLTPPVDATIEGTNIKAVLPYGTDRTALVATIITTGSSVTVNGVAQVSGTTANNFTNAVTYTVTAVDGTTRTYTATITCMPLDVHYLTGTISTWNGSSWVPVWKQREYSEDSNTFYDLDRNFIADGDIGVWNIFGGKGPDFTKAYESWYSWGAGTDGDWFTGDDATIAFITGASGTLHTAIDTSTQMMITNYATDMSIANILFFYKFISNSDGYLQNMELMSPGADGTVGGGDDTVQISYSYTYDAYFRVTSQISFTNKTTITYGDNGPTRVDVYTWNSTSSSWVLQYYKTVTYTANVITSSNVFLANGTQIARVGVDLDSSNRVSKLTVYNGAGTNGTWGDSDDVVGIYNSGGISVKAFDLSLFYSSSTAPVIVFEYNSYNWIDRATTYSDATCTTPVELFESSYGSTSLW